MKKMVITGASAGIGLATAQLFMENDYSVINLSRRICPLSTVTSIQCDLSDSGFLDSIAEDLAHLVENSEEIVLVHNAARYLRDSSLNTSDHILADVLQTNVIAPNALNRLIVPLMNEGSSIVYVGSTLGEKAVPGCFTYITSKHAQIGMMRSLCQDLAGYGVHTACVCPGFTDTEMLRSHVPDEAMNEITAMSAFSRLITPEEIARAVLWVAQSAVVNGSVIHANLGQIEK